MAPLFGIPKRSNYQQQKALCSRRVAHKRLRGTKTSRIRRNEPPQLNQHAPVWAVTKKAIIL